MRTVYSPDHARHDPQKELSDGALVDAVEKPARAEIVKARIEEVGLGSIEAPTAHDDALIARVHSADYLQFLEGFWADWRAAGRDAEAFPFVWPVPGLRRHKAPRHIDGRLGYYSFDAGSPLTEGTWDAARKGADTALSTVDIVSAGDRAAFALCRPPGHHAASDFYGGYCFLNNAAIAAEGFLAKGAERVAILDVDYHHGNGTQAIFEDRADVLFVSLHADPADEFPYFLGYADETGTGPGEGCNVNMPLAIGTDWPAYSDALAAALVRIRASGAEALVVSLGLDTFENDPISRFTLKSDDFRKMGRMLAGAGLPTAFIMEGGYAVAELGINCVNVLSDFEEAAG
ncbi:acetoin utilization deacetylase AcuC-like enzyme [Rhodobium orientis]|uniref:Acetylpolyamine amidohydrolase n=1 Tax=Rhodobium orientis TaxID=34017 RepID=A0A327JNR0_9HYPH|nr:histone deacetylase family protein [Rhodobium orientis]MBB4304642.1 acetoin utilization deacetylase AcuC-like enzyme [Rhodobium orientis]MBK5950017.1 acetylpolyamine amidohydrolase [Rhodobium orientis]RAI27711.1 acetylpolyamine amidohydrolase [Rhodobium orientis]